MFGHVEGAGKPPARGEIPFRADVSNTRRIRAGVLRLRRSAFESVRLLGGVSHADGRPAAGTAQGR